MVLTADAEHDFETLTAKLSHALDLQPEEKTVDNLHHLLLLARDEFEDDDQIFGLLNKYAFAPVTDVTKGIKRACHRVCKIVNDGGSSTGTLVGPDLVLAAMHTMRGTGDFAHPDDIDVLFDEFRFNDGQEHMIHSRAAKSVSGSQLQVVAFSRESELDYIIFRLESPIGLNRLGSLPRIRRGWMDLNTVNVAPQGEVIILQHPGGSLMKVSNGAVKTDMTGVPPGRFHYDTVTGAGSSGAPVLNQARQLVGMHVNSTDGIEELISLKAIFADLKSKNVRLPRYPPTKAFTNSFLKMLLEPQDDTAFA